MVVFMVCLLPSQLWGLRNQPSIGLFPFLSICLANITLVIFSVCPTPYSLLRICALESIEKIMVQDGSRTEFSNG